MEFTKEILDRFPEGVTIIDPDFRIEWINKSLRNKGFNIEFINGQKCYQVYKNQATICKDCPTLKAFSKKRTISHFEDGNDGKKYQITAVPIVKHGKVDRVIEISREIFPRKPVNNSSRVCEVCARICEKVVPAIESIGDAFFILDKDGRFVYSHIPDGIKISSSSKSFIGKRYSEVILDSMNEKFSRAFERNRHKKASELEHGLQGKSKKSWLSLKFSPIVRDNKFDGSVSL